MSHIVIMGGAFDPPHLGHTMVASIALSKIDCDEFWILPCYESAFGKNMSNFDHRVEMCKRAFEWVLGENIDVMSLEKDYKPKNSLEFITGLFTDILDREDDKITFVVGEDNWNDRHKWHRWEELEKMVEFFVVGRGEGGNMTVSIPNISSTQVRNLVAEDGNFEDFTSTGVANYIKENGLYKG